MYNAYNYNPYINTRYMQQPQQVEQTMQMPTAFSSVQCRSTLYGKQVDSVDMARNIEYPLDGSTSYYPVASGEAIVTKQMTIDGTPKITIYKPIEEQKEQVKYITLEDMNKALDGLDFDDIKDEISDIKKELKELKKKGKSNE